MTGTVLGRALRNRERLLLPLISLPKCWLRSSRPGGVQPARRATWSVTLSWACPGGGGQKRAPVSKGPHPLAPAAFHCSLDACPHGGGRDGDRPATGSALSSPCTLQGVRAPDGAATAGGPTRRGESSSKAQKQRAEPFSNSAAETRIARPTGPTLPRPRDRFENIGAVHQQQHRRPPNTVTAPGEATYPVARYPARSRNLSPGQPPASSLCSGPEPP